MVITLTKTNASQEISQSKKPIVIDVFATWCGPCMEMKPIFEALAQKYSEKYLFAQVNVDEARELAISYGVTSVPTFIFIKDGTVMGKETGYMAEEELIAKIEEHFGK